jgi:glutaminyl-peptide cyclotransferase
MAKIPIALAFFAFCAGIGAIIVFTPFQTAARPGDESKLVREAPKPGEFDGDRALKHIVDLCAIGPRISGTEGMKKQQEMLQKHFEGLGAKVEFQRFDGIQRSRDKACPMANMIISWHPNAMKRVLICGHYDTRPIADQEPRRADWTKPFVSANDGTSTVALMMELGRHMKELKTHVGVDFIIFDGEEYIFDTVKDRFFLGSDHFGKEYKNNKPVHKYSAGILLDLFAGKNATYPVERNSQFMAGPLVEDIWGIAKELGVISFKNVPGVEVQDDHLALNRAGIPTIDIIDFDYPHWHRLADTPEECSPTSMEDVAKVLMEWFRRVK